MSKQVRILLLLATLWVPWATQSQVTSATFSTGIDATRWITLSANATTLTFTGSDDDGVSNVCNIGFPFYFGQGNYAQFSCNTNGVMRLGTEVTNTSYYTMFSAGNVGSNLPKLTAYGRDHSVRSTNGHYVKYELTGTAPNRILVIETRQSNGYSASDHSIAKYQVQLYETSSKLVFVYDSNTSSMSSSQVGMASSATDVLTINTANHTVTNGATGTTVNTWPGIGRYYEFTPTIPTCLPPAWAGSPVLTATTATLNWTGSASSYVLEYSTAAFTPGTSAGTVVNNITGTTTTLTGLTPTTTYYAYLHGDCGAGDTSLNISTTFTTECAPISRSNMPYLNDFSISSSTTNLPDCWKRGVTSRSYPKVGYYNGRDVLRFLTSSYVGSTCMAILPSIEMGADSLEVVFDAYKSSASAPGDIIIGVMTDPSVDTTFVPVDTVTVSSTSSWSEMEASLASYTDTGHYLAFRYTGGDYTSVYVSNMQIMQYSSCRKPTVAYASNVTHESAQVNIQDADNMEANGYMLYYGTTNDRAVATDSVLFTGLSTTLTGLEYITPYYAWVRAQCSDENSRERAFTFTTLPPCAVVNDLTCLVNAANGTAVLSWNASTDGIAATGYEVRYKASDANDWTTATTAANYYQITGLTTGTSYEYNVISQCGTYISADNSGSFVLAGCNTIAEGNTTNNGAPFNGYYNNSYSQSLYTSAELATMGDTINGVYFTNTNTSASKTFTLDVYMGSTDVNSFATSSDWINGDSLTLVASALSVTVSGAGQVYLPFSTPFVRNHAKNVVVAIDNNTGSCTSYSDKPIWSSTVTTTNRSIYIYDDYTNYNPASISDGSVSGYVPDITFNASCATPSCAAPLLICTGKTTNSLDLRWFAGLDETSWTIDYRLRGDSLWTNVLTATTLTATTLTGLATGETYEVRVKNSCSTDSTFLAIKEISTECGQMAVPYAENFENQPTGYYSRNCWQTGAAAYALPYVIDNPANGKIMEISDGGYLVAPDFVLSVPSLQMHLNYGAILAGSSLYVGVVTDPTNIQSFVPIDTLTVYDATLRFSKTIHFDSYTGNGGNLCLYAPMGVDFYVDNILIGENYFCPSVDTMWASNVTATAAAVSWNIDAYGTASSYLVEYGPAGFALGTGTRMDVPEATVALSGLTHSTVYDVYVTPICSMGDTMFVSTPVRFQTDCEAMSLPYSMNFDLAYLSTQQNTHQMPPCWTTELLDQSDDNAPQIAWNGKYSQYAQSGLNYLHFSDAAVAALPEMSASLNDVQLSFYAKASYSSYQLVVGVVDSLAPGFAASFVPVDTIDCASGVNDTVVFCSYAGTGQYIALKNITSSSYGSYSNIYMDDVKVSLRPTCMPVTNLACDTATQNTMGISWATSSCNTPQGYQVEYGYHGYVQGNGRLLTTTANTVTITGLHPAMRYDVYVRSICAAGDTSAWTKASVATQSCVSPDEMAMYDATATTTSSYIPAYSDNKYGYSQVIYDRATMIAAGFSAGSVVTGFAFYPTTTDGGDVYSNCSVLMKNSSKTEFASDTDFEAMEPSNLVYTGDLNWDAVGWRYVAFDAPFYWDGTSNVVIAVDRNTGSYRYGDEATFQAISCTANRGIYAHGYSSNVDPYTLSGVANSTNSTTTTIPTYKFYSCADIHLNNIVANSTDETMGTAVGGSFCMTGDTLVLTAVPATGHHFTQWTDGVATTTRSVVVTGDATFTAAFAIDVYTVVVESNDTALGTVTGGGSYDYGTSITLAANAITGYHLEQWSDGNTDNPRTLTATENATYVASFAINSYMIATTVNGAAMGTVAGGGNYDYNTTATLTANANAGYHFVQWSDGDTANPRILTVTADGSYEATFAINNYMLTVVSNDTAMGTVTGGGRYNHNATATLAATPKTEFRFVKWSDGITTNPRTLTVTEEATLTAVFATNKFILTAIAEDTLSGSVSGDGNYLSGTMVTMTATANDGYRFDHWHDGNTDNPRTVTVMNDTTYIVTFIPYVYQIAATSSDTLLGTVAGGGSYDYNSTATLTAIGATGYHFTQWSDGDTTNPRLVTVKGDSAFTASFAISTFTLTAIANDTLRGTVTGSGSYVYRTTATLTATANEECFFVQWSDGDTANPHMVTVVGDATYTATFGINSYRVTATAFDTALGSVTGSGSYDYNSTATLTAIGATGYHFTQWSDGDTTNPRLVTVKGDTALAAIFAIDRHTLTVLTADTVMGSTLGSGEYDYNTEATFTAVAKTGYVFTQWNDGDTINPRTATVTSDTTFTASFVFDRYILTVNSADTTLGTVTGGGSYDYRTMATLTAIPATECHLVQWSDGDTTNHRQVQVIGNATYTATFAVNSYLLSAVSSDAVMGTVTGGGSYDYGTTVTLEASPLTGYHFVQWSDGIADTLRTVTVSYDTAFTAVFAPNVYTIGVSSNNRMLGTVTGGGDYDYSTIVTLTATPATECHLVQWSDGDTATLRTVTVTGDADYTATFAVNSYELSLTSADTAMGSVTGGATYDYGTTAILTANALTGYHFVQWSDGITTNPRTLTMTRDTVISATFAATGYTIMVASADIDMGSVNGGGRYYYHTEATLTATAATGHHFLQWNDGNTANPRTINVTGAATYIATFAVNSYVVSATAANTAMGSVTGGGSYDYHATATLTATANEGHRFVQWTDGIVSNPRSVTVVSDTALTATFAINSYVVTASSADAVMGTVTGGGNYDYNAEATLTAAANTGYHFVQWSDGIAINPRTVTVTENGTYTATFAANSYAITATTANAAMGSVSGSGNYSYNVTATLVATANAGYHFTQWSDGNSMNPRNVIVTDNATYTASFAANSYAITAATADATMGSVTGGGSYAYNATATLAATATTGYHFVSWNDGNTANPRTLTVVGSATYIATFAANSYAITATAADATMGTVTGGGTYDYNATANLTATAAMGYHFVQWNDGNIANPRTITVTANATYSATFAADSYVVTATSANATMGTVTGGGSYGYNATATLTATASTGYHFVRWSDGSTVNPRTITVTGAATYIATFATSTYAITATSADITMGTVSGSGSYGYNATATLMATARTGYHFVQWSDGDTTNPRTITVTGDATYTATFAVSNYVVTATAADADMGTVTGGGSYAYGTTATLTATASTGYHFVQWSDGNTANPRTITVTGDATYTANFAAISYVITATSADATMGTVTGGGSYDYNATVTLTATANDGYKFVQWSDGNTDNPRTVTVTGDATYTAIFHTVGIHDASALTALSLYPNPTEGQVTLSAETVIKVEVLDGVGRKVATFSNQRVLNLTVLPSGIYTLRVTLPEGTAIRKVVKR